MNHHSTSTLRDAAKLAAKKYVKDFKIVCLGPQMVARYVLDALIDQGLYSDQLIVCSDGSLENYIRTNYDVRLGTPKHLLPVEGKMYTVDKVKDFNEIITSGEYKLEPFVTDNEEVKKLASDLGYIVVSSNQVGKEVDYVHVSGVKQILGDISDVNKIDKRQTDARYAIIDGKMITGYGRYSCLKKMKKLADNSKLFLTIAKESQIVDKLGSHGCKFSVEFVPGMQDAAISAVYGAFTDTLGIETDFESFIEHCKPTVRKSKKSHRNTLTEDGNNILEFKMWDYGDPKKLAMIEHDIKSNDSIHESDIYAVRRPGIVVPARMNPQEFGEGLTVK